MFAAFRSVQMNHEDPHGAPSSGMSHFNDAFNIMIRFATLL
jgi:hypothetical protein